MKSLLLDVNKNRVTIVDPQGLDDYYDLIGCRLIDIPARRIGEKWFNIICDDEGALKDYPRVSAIDDHCNTQLVGSLIITGGVDEEGELLPLSEDDIIYLSRYIRPMIMVDFETRKPEYWLMLTHCNY